MSEILDKKEKKEDGILFFPSIRFSPFCGFFIADITVQNKNLARCGWSDDMAGIFEC